MNNALRAGSRSAVGSLLCGANQARIHERMIIENQLAFRIALAA